MIGRGILKMLREKGAKYSKRLEKAKKKVEISKIKKVPTVNRSLSKKK